jgi:hypothetical protein
MPATPAYRIKVIQPDAGLADGERVGGRRHLPGGDKRLKIGNRGDGEVDIVSPASHHRIPLDAGVAAGLEEAEIVLAHLIQTVLAPEYGRAYEGVGIAGRIPAGLSLAVPGPEEFAAFAALLALESLIHEEVQSILILGEHSRSAFAETIEIGMLKGFLKGDFLKRGFLRARRKYNMAALRRPLYFFKI